MNQIDKRLIPKEVSDVTETLEKAGFEAYLVGGCVRDLVLEKDPKDWDVTTNAKPEQIIELFEKTVYENTFGTVGVVVSCETLKSDVSRITSNLEPRTSNPEPNLIEVTPYRLEASYSDFRHPDEVRFSNNIEDDLKRRDFTVNALAYRKGEIKDMFGGLKDIQDKILKTVGGPEERFREDALRMLRAIRFSVQLDFLVSHETLQSINKNANLIKNISTERVRDEFLKIIMSKNPAIGIGLLQKLGLLKHIIPELEEGIACEQSGEHIYDVWEHLLQALQHAADKNLPLEIRLSALFHDIGKPKSRRKGEKKKFTFYGHEVISARMSKKILERLKFPKKEAELVEKLVRYHMFFSDTEKITLSAVRRVITKVGAENIWSLMEVRECDRVGMKKKEAPYRLRKYFAMIEEALRDPISVGQLKINGNDLIKELKMAPGPRIGWILNALLEEVLDDPAQNTREHLLKLAESINQLPEKALQIMGERGKEKKEELEEEEIKKLHKKHGV